MDAARGSRTSLASAVDAVAVPVSERMQKRGNRYGYAGAAILPWNRSRPLCRAPTYLRRTIGIDGLHRRRPVRRCGVSANPSRLATGQVALRDRPPAGAGLIPDGLYWAVVG